jgi:predicted O-methyltransferase YrrM
MTSPFRRAVHVLKRWHQRYWWPRTLPPQLRKLLPLPDPLAREIDRFNASLNTLPGGWCPLTKQHVLAALVARHSLTRIVEIGVFQGGSLLPMAAAARMSGGTAVGIDPYSAGAAEQKDNCEKFVPVVGLDWHERIDWDGLFTRVSEAIGRFGLSDHCRLVRSTSAQAAALTAPGLDLLHIDGNHDDEAVASDVALYVPKVRSGGFIVLDDTNWDGVFRHYESLKQGRSVYYEAPGRGARPEWAILVQH